MDFGKNILEKYGWKEGEGLGKNNDGIKAPVKASLKFDASGLGADPARELTERWWERVYNESSRNIVVGNKNDKVTVDLIDAEGVEVTNKSYSKKKLKNKNISMTYGSFLKSATKLANSAVEEDIPDRVQPEDIQIITLPKVLTDEELLAACGGRTAHKGARHGLKLLGKLSRIEQQDKILIEKINNVNDLQGVFSERKAPPKLDLSDHMEEEVDELEGIVNNTEYVKKLSKKEKKRMRELERSLSNKINNSLSLDDDTKKKESEVLALKNDGAIAKSKSEKKKKKKIKQNMPIYIQIPEGGITIVPTIKVKKDKKSKKNDQPTTSKQSAKDFLKNQSTTSTSTASTSKKASASNGPVAIPRKLSCTDSEAEEDDNEHIDIIDKINKDREMQPKLSEFEQKHMNEVPKKLKKILKNEKEKKRKKKHKKIKMELKKITESLKTISNLED